MRKWCVDCRRVISLEQARTRRVIVVQPNPAALANIETDRDVSETGYAHTTDFRL